MASAFQSISTSPTFDEPTSRITLSSPNHKHKKWEYLISLESTPTMSRWEYLNSLDAQALPTAPKIVPVYSGGDDFYDEPEVINRTRSSRLVCPVKKKMRNRRIYLVLYIIVLLAAIVTGIVLGIRYRQANSQDSVSVGVSSSLYESNTDIIVTIVTGDPKSAYWVGIWQSNKAPGGIYTISDTPPAMWMNLCADDGSGNSSCTRRTTLTFSKDSGWESSYVGDWPLCNGKWVACVIDDDSKANVACTESFVVVDGSCDGVCKPATSTLSKSRHLNPVPMTPLSKIAFGSNFYPEKQIDSRLWAHMRETFQPDLWVWLGNNVFADGEDMEIKRAVYNANKLDLYYQQYGPVADPMIPVTGTWDGHDAGVDYRGAEYQCYKLAQDEFAYWFNLPAEDPRHPAQGTNQQQGVYSSIMFSKPNQPDVNGVHLILLDVRYHRSPTFAENGHCQGANSTVLGHEQWKWLGHELKKKSRIKVIGTGMQVMQPTDQVFTDVNTYCANDNSTFFDAIDDLSESEQHLGTQFETWGQIPQEKLRLLRYLQRSISDGFTDKVIIISGNVQWGEVMAKKLSAAEDYGQAQVIFEVTASGIDINYPFPDPNANRLKVRSADSAGDGIFQHECKFPFKYNGDEYNTCIKIDEETPWCATLVDMEKNYMPGDWGYCLPESDELVPRANITVSEENSGYEALHVCKAQSNYGGIEVDWDNNLIQLYLFTPHATNPLAGKVTIGM